MGEIGARRVSPPLAVITPYDQGGLIAVITALSLSFVLVAFLTRIAMRFSSGPWKRDDLMFVAAIVSPMWLLKQMVTTDIRPGPCIPPGRWCILWRS